MASDDDGFDAEMEVMCAGIKNEEDEDKEYMEKAEAARKKKEEERRKLENEKEEAAAREAPEIISSQKSVLKIDKNSPSS